MFAYQTADFSLQGPSIDMPGHVHEDLGRTTSGTVFNIMRYSIHDGPGIRTTVFFKGCPLRCRWCHNPEGQSPDLELFFRLERCIRCGECSKSCPQSAISSNGVNTSLDRCQRCGDCVKVCQSKAREMIGKNMTVAQVMEEVEKDIVFYDESGGGATFSGGEPFMQSAFLHELLRLCREKKIHTAVETCGLTRSDILSEISSHVDLFLYDLKVIDAPIHRRFTGVSNSVILENLKMLSRHHAHVVVRFPLVPGVNDDEENLSQTARFVKSLTNVKEIQILPYHLGAVEKYKGLGRTYELLNIKPPSEEEIRNAGESFTRHQLKVRIGG